VPEQSVLDSHWTHALFEQCGLAVGQSLSPTHCTHPGGFVVPQRTGPALPSSPLEASLAAPLELPLDASLAVPLELPLEPLEEPLEEPLDAPLEDPLSEDPLEDPGPPSGLVAVLPPLLQPVPMAMAVAMANPRHVLNDDMAGLASCQAIKP
jgi:hypothetical protein